MIRSSIVVLLFSSLFFISCKKVLPNSSDGMVVAKVGDVELYDADFKDIFFSQMSDEDSIQMRENFINNWIKQELIYQAALENLSDSAKNKDKELEQYYRSLIQYEYQNALVNQNLDTAVSLYELREYYDQYPESFELKGTAIRAIYLELHVDYEKLSKVRYWMNDINAEFADSLHQCAVQHSRKYQFDENKWFYLDDILTELQVNREAIEPKLNENRMIEISDTVNIKLIRILEVNYTGHISPFKFSMPKIRAILKNNKKVNYLNQMEKNLMDDARRNHKFEIIK